MPEVFVGSAAFVAIQVIYMGSALGPAPTSRAIRQGFGVEVLICTNTADYDLCRRVCVPFLQSHLPQRQSLFRCMVCDITHCPTRSGVEVEDMDLSHPNPV